MLDTIIPTAEFDKLIRTIENGLSEGRMRSDRHPELILARIALRTLSEYSESVLEAERSKYEAENVKE